MGKKKKEEEEEEEEDFWHRFVPGVFPFFLLFLLSCCFCCLFFFFNAITLMFPPHVLSFHPCVLCIPPPLALHACRHPVYLSFGCYGCREALLAILGTRVQEIYLCGWFDFDSIFFILKRNSSFDDQPPYERIFCCFLAYINCSYTDSSTEPGSKSKLNDRKHINIFVCLPVSLVFEIKQKLILRIICSSFRI